MSERAPTSGWNPLAEWVIALSGWVFAGVVLVRAVKMERAFSQLLELADTIVAEAKRSTEGVHRVRLSCPLCAWTDTVIREDQATALAEGERRIVAHNDAEGHVLVPGAKPRVGYYRGEPLN